MWYSISASKKDKLTHIGMYRDKITADRVALLFKEFVGKGFTLVRQETSSARQIFKK